MARRGQLACLARPSTWAAQRFYSDKSKGRVAFIGLGNMGFSMAANLLKDGYTVVACDVSAGAVDRLVEKGAIKAATPKEAAADAATVVSMVPASDHVRAVYLGDEGVLKSVQSGAVLIDASTIDPHVAIEVASASADAGAMMVDAPVSGGVTGAAAGTLTFMVGGGHDALEKARPVLEAMGSKIVHCGKNGCGQVVKICNNLALAIEMIGVSEALNLGVKLGMDPKLMTDIFNSSTSRCWSCDSYNPVPGVMDNVPSSRNYEGGFGVDLMTKDLSLAINAAHKVKASLPLGSSSLQLYNLISSHGHGKKDFGFAYGFLNNMYKPKE